MPKGISLHAGLNKVDPNHYGGWSGPLTACEADAEDMRDLAKAEGFAAKTLLTKAATRKAVIAGIQAAAKQLKAGDFFFLSYSGHGGQVPDEDDDEPDHADETWCLYDGELIDDELGLLWSKFAKGVRILLLSDSCHSGTVAKMAMSAAAYPATGRYRAMPPDVALRTYRQNVSFYRKLAAATGKAKAGPVRATVRLISGCQDNQLSSDGAFNGLFTANLLAVWKHGAFAGNYKEFHKAIVARMPAVQTPNHFLIGAANAAYDAQTPFRL